MCCAAPWRRTSARWWWRRDSEAVAAAVEKAGGRAVMTRADHVSGSDRIFEALQALDPERRFDIVVNVQGDLPTIDPADIRAALGPLADAGVDIATLAAEIADPDERDNPERRQGDRHAGGARPPARALLHARHRAVGRGAALSPYRALRLPPRRAGALRHAAALAARAAREARAVARARGRHAHRRRGGRKPCRSASIRRRIWPRRAPCSAVDAPGGADEANLSSGTPPSPKRSSVIAA